MFSRLSRRLYSTLPSTHSQTTRQLKYLGHTVDTTHLTTLENGMQVVSRDHLGGVSQISVRVNVGTRDETYQTNGISHFVQRFFFGPTVNRTYVNLTTVLQNIGADASAQHGREEIVYTSNQLRDAVPTALEIMSDSIVYARLHEWDLGSKRRLVEDDMEQFKQYPDLVLDELLHKTAYGNRGLGNSLACPEHNLNSITIQQVRQFMDDNLTGENMRVVGTNVEHEDLVALTRELFQEVPKSSENSASRQKSKYFGGSAQVSDSSFIPGEQTSRAALAFEGFARNSKNYFNALVLKHVLGSAYRVSPAGPKSTAGGDYGLLAREALEISPELTTVQAFNHAYSDSGLFGVKLAGFDGAVVGAGVELAMSTLEQIAKQGVPKSVLAFAQRRAAIELAQATSNLAVEHEYILQNPDRSETEDVRRVFSVQPENVQQVAYELVTQSKPTLVSYGKCGGIPYAL